MAAPNHNFVANGFVSHNSGPEPLILLHSFIKETFQKAQGRKLSTLECLDLANEIAGVVVVGGVRRSSQISFSDLDDESLQHAKDFPFPLRRSMSNNSVLYNKKPTAAEFLKEWASLVASGTGERGIFNLEGARKRSPKRRKAELIQGTNPCQPSYATLLTLEGIKTFGEVNEGDVIWSGLKWTKIIKKRKTGTKPVHRYSTSLGHFIGTKNHKIVSNGVKIEISKAKSIDSCTGPSVNIKKINHQDIMDGLSIGDGSIHKASNDLVLLYIGKKDQDYFKSKIKNLIIKYRPGIGDDVYTIKTTIQSHELPKTYLRKVPDRFRFGSPEKKAGFFGFILDILFLPIVGLGRWLSNKWKKYNAIAVFFSVLVDLPFQIFIEFLEQWRYFLKEKKDEIH